MAVAVCPFLELWEIIILSASPSYLKLKHKLEYAPENSVNTPETVQNSPYSPVFIRPILICPNCVERGTIPNDKNFNAILHRNT